MAYLYTAFSGPIACKVLSRENGSEYMTDIASGIKYHFSRLSCHIRVKITARKHSAYKHGEILTVFAMDIYDSMYHCKSGMIHYKGKQWAQNVPIQAI